jgi:putative oxidoreductase
LGFQFAQTGWGKLHNLPKIAAFFARLNIPFPGFNVPFISMLELAGGIRSFLTPIGAPTSSSHAR